LSPRPFTAGLCYSNAFVPMLRARPGDAEVDAMLTDDGVVWQREDD
jgi:hypothetical protein